MTTIQESLRLLADAYPDGAAVPIPKAWLVRLLDGTTVEPDHTPAADLTVPDVAKLFDRSPVTVRGWLERGLFPGAYRLRGRAWRIPPAAVEHFRASQAAVPESASDVAFSTPISIQEWRRRKEVA